MNRQKFQSFFHGHRNRRKSPKRSLVEILELRALLTADLTPTFTSLVPPGQSPFAHFDYVLYSQEPGQLSPYGSVTPPATAFNPATLKSAYGINQITDGGVLQDGTGMTVVIIDAFDNPKFVSRNSSADVNLDTDFLASDLHKFDLQYGLPEPAGFFTKVDQNGGNSYPVGDTGWGTEIALDVEWVHATAPGAKIILVEAADNSNTNLISNAASWARDHSGGVAVTMSFGASEFGTTYDSVFHSPADHGITWLASTGDSGAPGGYPAFSPNVVAVGGTTLTAPGGVYSSESAWSDGGGGLSVYETQPAYQSGLVIHNGGSIISSGGKRAIPDISIVADPATGAAVYDSFSQGAAAPWLQVGGTSLSSPVWAGLVAIADEIRANHGRNSLDGATEFLPSLYDTHFTSDYHDITTGSNGYSAGPGYDLTTGLGTPKANTLIRKLAGVNFSVDSSTPAINGVVATPPTSFVINFSDAVDPASLQASDLTINSIAATGVSLSADNKSATFSYGTSPVTAQGLQTMSIANNAVTKLGDATTGLASFNATFRYDTLTLQVTSTTPTAPNGVFNLSGPLTYDVNFNEVLDPTSVQTSDLSLSGIAGATVSNVTVLPGNTTARFTLSGITTEGALNATIAAGSIADQYGNPGAAFFGTYSVDIGALALPTPLAAINPLGSLIYNSSTTGYMGPGDSDTFTLSANSGQTITVIVKPTDPQLQPSIQLLDPSNAIIGSATAGAAGQSAILQTISATTAGAYSITVTGAGGTVGNYSIQVILNAAQETESALSGIDNGSVATAQNIDGGFVNVGVHGDRGAVVGAQGLGASAATVDFESGTLPASFSTYSSNSFGRIQVTTPGSTGNNSLYALMMDSNSDGNYVLNEAVYTVQLNGISQATLNFSHVNFSDEADLLPSSFVGHANGDGVAISADGNTWWTIFNATSADSTWTNTSIDLAAAAASAGITLGSDFKIKFQQYDNFGITTDGRGYDNISISVPDSDYYSFHLNAGQTATIAATAGQNVNMSLDLLNGSNTVLASGVSAVNVTKAITNFVAPTTGTYYVRISSNASTLYSLVVTRDTAFDIEPNDSQASSQNVSGTQAILGALSSVASTGKIGYFTDNAPGSTGPSAPILQAGFTPIQITNISTFDLSTIDILMVDEESNSGLSSAMASSLPAIQTWVQSGGVFIVHDRFVAPSSSPTSVQFLIGTSGVLGRHDSSIYGTDLNVIPPGTTLVTAGPFGTISDTTLDGGNSSNHGWIEGATLPAGATKILSAGPNPANVSTFSYPLGNGTVYYSTIPLDFYLDGNGPNPPQGNFKSIYTPNVLTYVNSLRHAVSEDWYSFNVNDLSSIRIESRTPSYDAGQTSNTLNPHLELYGPSGNLVASGAVQADGRNEVLDYQPTLTGTYKVRVTSEAGTSGEYELLRNIFSVVGSSPMSGETVSTPPTNFVINYSDAIDPTSLQASDLTVNSIAADHFALSPDYKTATFTFDTSPVTVQGLETMTMTAGAVTKQGEPATTNTSFTASFRYDVVLLTVTSTNPPTPNGVFNLPGPFTYDVHFNEAINPASVQASDLIVSGIPGAGVSGVTILPGNTTARFTLSGINSEGPLSTTIAAGAVTDQFGNPGLAFNSSYAVDIDTIALPTPLSAQNPLGSLVYSSSANGLIGSSGDLDSFTLKIDPGQKVTIIVTPTSPGLQPTITLLDPSNAGIGVAAATAAGQPVVLQNIAATAGGTYTIEVGDVGGTTGAYSVQVLLNASAELEGLIGGVNNDSAATAQSLDSSMITLGTPGLIRRGAVIGTIATTVDQDYYSVNLTAGDTLSVALKGSNSDLTTQLRGSDGTTVLATTIAGATNLDSTLTDFAVTATGTYYLVIGGATGGETYDAVITKNAEFSTESNDTIPQAQELLSRQAFGNQWALGYIGAGNSSDLYKVNLASGAMITLQTYTPADGPGEFVNLLDPRVRILDAAGNQVAINDNGAPDGKNALLNYTNTGPAATFYVEVSSALPGATQGEYVLRVAGNTVVLPSFHVADINPADGVRLRIAPTNVTVHFNDNLLLTSIAASDLKVDGISATGFTIQDNETVVFTLPAGLTQGNHTITIAAGAIADVQSTGIDAFTSSFALDLTGPRVVATSIGPNQVIAPGSVSYQLTFDESMLAANLSADDFNLHGVQTGRDYVADSYSFDASGKVLTINYSNLPEDKFNLSLIAGVSGGDNFTDLAGNALDGEFTGTFPSGNGVSGGDFKIGFTADASNEAFPLPLTAHDPAGSLIYSTSLSRSIVISGVTDKFTLAVDPGQTITVLVTPQAPSLKPAVQLLDPSNAVIAGGSATAAGRNALLQTATAATAGTYTVVVGGAASTIGSYTVEVILNAALESESYLLGGNNDTLATAQSLDGSLISLNPSGSAKRGAVEGANGAAVGADSLADFEAGQDGYTINNNIRGTGNAAGLWHLTSNRGSDPGHSSFTSFYYGNDFTDTYDTGAANAGAITSPSIAIGAVGQTNLSFNYLLQTEGSSSTYDLAKVQVSNNGGASFITLASSADGSQLVQGGAWQTATFDLSAFAGQNIQIRFSFDTVDASANSYEGWYVDDVQVSPAWNDYYSVHLNAGDHATVALKNTSGVGTALQLLDSAGNVIAAGAQTATNLNLVANNISIPTTGIYYVKVSGQVAAAYDIVLMENAAFDTESNNSQDSAQSLGGNHNALGYVVGGSNLFDLTGAPVNGPIILSGSKITLGFNTDGSFITGGVGIQYNGVEFVAPGTPVASFTVAYNGFSYTNNVADGISEISIVAMQDISSGDMLGLRIVGIAGDLQVERIVVFNQNDDFVTIATRLTNLSGAALNNVATLENLDPDQENYSTSNDVVLNGQFVRASGEATGLTIGLGSTDPRSVVSAGGFENRDPFEIINFPQDPNGAPGDIAIAQAFNYGNLNASDQVSGVMVIAFGATPDAAEAVFTANSGGTVSSNSDWYSFDVASNTALLELTTATPGDGPGGFGNTLDPAIELYDPAGNLVASGVTSADGRNESINFQPGMAGTYSVRVTGQNNTAGDYFLDTKSFLTGDLNQDGVVNTDDLGPFMAALRNQYAFQQSANLTSAEFLALADVNRDGYLSNSDLQAFLNLLKSAPSPANSPANVNSSVNSQPVQHSDSSANLGDSGSIIALNKLPESSASQDANPPQTAEYELSTTVINTQTVDAVITSPAAATDSPSSPPVSQAELVGASNPPSIVMPSSSATDDGLEMPNQTTPASALPSQIVFDTKLFSSVTDTASFNPVSQETDSARSFAPQPLHLAPLAVDQALLELRDFRHSCLGEIDQLAEKDIADGTSADFFDQLQMHLGSKLFMSV